MAEFSGALIFANASEALTSGGYRTPSFPAEAYDEGGWYDPIDNGIIRIPSGISLVRPAFNFFYSVSGIDGRVVKNGASYFGLPHAEALSAGTEAVNAVGAIIAVTAGNTLAAQINAPNGSLNASGLSWFFVESIPAATNYALVGKNSSQAIASNTTTALVWQTEAADTLGFHNGSSNNSRFTIPSGTTGLFRLTANISSPGSLNGAALEIRKNGSGIPGLPIRDSESGGAIQLNLISAIIEATQGDYFEAYFRSSGTAVSVGSADNNWFQIEEVQPCLRALAYLSAPQAISASTATQVSINTPVYDIGGWMMGSSFVVPAGVTHVRMTFRVEGSSQTVDMHGYATINGANPVGTPLYHSDTTGTDFTSGQSAIIPVNTGDEIALMAYSTLGRDVAAGSWLGVEAANFHEAQALQASAFLATATMLMVSATAHQSASANFVVRGTIADVVAARITYAAAIFAVDSALTARGALADPWSCQPGAATGWICQ